MYERPTVHPCRSVLLYTETGLNLLVMLAKGPTQCFQTKFCLVRVMMVITVTIRSRTRVSRSRYLIRYYHDGISGIQNMV